MAVNPPAPLRSCRGRRGQPWPPPASRSAGSSAVTSGRGSPESSTALGRVSLKRRKGMATILEISWFDVLNGREDGSGGSCPHVLARPRHDPAVLGWHSVKCKESPLPSRDKHYQGWKEKQGWWFCNALCQQGNGTVWAADEGCPRPGCRSLCPQLGFPLLHINDVLFQSSAERSLSLKREHGAWGWKGGARCSCLQGLQSSQHSCLGAEVQCVPTP